MKYKITTEEVNSRLIAVFQRFANATNRRSECSMYHPVVLFREQPQVQAIAARARLVKHLSEQLVHRIEELVDKEFGVWFMHRAYQEGKILAYRMTDIQVRLQMRAYVSVNGDYLKGRIHELRQSSSDRDAFDQRVYTDLGIDVMIDGAIENWKRGGSLALIKRAAKLLAQATGSEINLVSEEAAFENYLITLEEFVEEFEHLVIRYSKLVLNAREAGYQGPFLTFRTPGGDRANGETQQ